MSATVSMRAGRRGALVALSILALLLVGPVVRAETIDEVTNPRESRGGWVSDMADLFTVTQRDSLDALSSALERTNGAELAVVTVHHTGDLPPKEFATALFNRWGVGKRGSNDGVLVLIVADPHRIEVETGYGAEALLPDGRIGRILDRDVIPRFREGDWGGGAIAGVTSMAAALREEAPRGLPLLPQAPTRHDGGALVLCALAVLLGAGGWLVQRQRFLRVCGTCHRRMRLLTEEEDDAYLDAMQRFEESLRSVNHVAWRCDTCQALLLEHRNEWFSGYSKCPKCTRRTLAHQSITLREATETRTGLREVTSTCRLPGCGYTHKDTETIPKVESSSSGGSSGGFSFGGGGGSSGGGSFGGGSSGGGGAGRSW